MTLGDPAHFTPWPNYIQRSRGWNMITVLIFIIGGNRQSDHRMAGAGKAGSNEMESLD